MPPAFTPNIESLENAVSPALQIIGKMKDTLQGRTVALLYGKDSDADQIEQLKAALKKEDANCKLVSLKVGGATLSNGQKLVADMQLASAPSVIFDAVIGLLSAKTVKQYAKNPNVKEWFINAYVHLKAIGYNEATKTLLDEIGIVEDKGINPIHSLDLFLQAAKTRQWQREALFN